MVAFVLVASACGRDPKVTYARLLERAASWSASVQFTAEMARARYVPRAFVHDVLSTSVNALATIRRQIQDDRDVDARSRTQTADLCGRLAALVEDADRARALPDDRPLRDIEIRLRAAAQAARGLVPLETPW
ncbi:MAG: hypothetical protein AUH43_08850 [Acidobacteria bacterium 13_1_40CM_65_14]|nr:MAG: hypothetical protein AUH43_08850 [Acidobacteria bacterium 13_1_40CM_65_14]OLE79843.1 MAG: hypothetical protein AUF76_15660 [Acidobacteria bacterium 13_1_20CM_2_65_9]